VGSQRSKDEANKGLGVRVEGTGIRDIVGLAIGQTGIGTDMGILSYKNLAPTHEIQLSKLSAWLRSRPIPATTRYGSTNIITTLHRAHLNQPTPRVSAPLPSSHEAKIRDSSDSKYLTGRYTKKRESNVKGCTYGFVMGWDVQSRPNWRAGIHSHSSTCNNMC